MFCGMATIALITKGVGGGIYELGRALKADGHKSVVFVCSEYVDKFRESGLFDTLVAISDADLYSSEKLIALFSNYFGDNLPEGVVCCYDPTGPTFCEILKKFYGDKNEATALMNCYQKSAMRRVLTEKGADDLPFFEIRNSKDLDNLPQNGRWVLKPAIGTSSELVSSPLSNISEIKECYKNALKKGHEQKYLLEKYIDGLEYSVEGIKCGDEIVIAGIFQKQGLHIVDGIRVEGVNSTPIENPEREKLIKEIVTKTIKSVGLKSSAFHIELRWDNLENKPHIVEINPRLPGGLLCMIHRERHKIDLARSLINVRLGLGIPKITDKPRTDYFGNLPMPATKAGIYNGFKLPDSLSAKNRDGLNVEIIEFIPTGTFVDPSISEVYYAHAYIIAKDKETFWWGAKECDHVQAIIDPA